MRHSASLRAETTRAAVMGSLAIVGLALAMVVPAQAAEHLPMPSGPKANQAVLTGLPFAGIGLNVPFGATAPEPGPVREHPERLATVDDPAFPEYEYRPRFSPNVQVASVGTTFRKVDLGGPSGFMAIARYFAWFRPY